MNIYADRFWKKLGSRIGWPQVLIPNLRDTDHICKQMAKYKLSNPANVPSLYHL